MSTADEEPAPLGESARRFVDAARPHERLSESRKAHLRGRVMAAVAAGAGATLAAGAAKAAEIGAAGAGSSGVGAAGSAGVGAAGAGSAGVGSAGVGAAGAGSAGVGSAGVGAGLAGGAVKAAGFSLLAKVGVSVAVVTIGAGSLLWSRAHEPRGQGSAPSIVTTANPFDDDTPPSSAPPVQEPSASATAADTAAPTGFPSAGAIANEPRANPLDVIPAAASAAPSSGAPSAASSSAPVDTLPEEMKLLAAAHAELSRGNPSGALALLDEHAAKYPRGTMAPERRATRAMALCKAGRTEEGLREVTALYGPDSKSPMAQKIAHACGK
ncbi:MAG: hypothetical protein U0441_12100 [Polyangiaceae bacterium]